MQEPGRELEVGPDEDKNFEKIRIEESVYRFKLLTWYTILFIWYDFKTSLWITSRFVRQFSGILGFELRI